MQHIIPGGECRGLCDAQTFSRLTKHLRNCQMSDCFNILILLYGDFGGGGFGEAGKESYICNNAAH